MWVKINFKPVTLILILFTLLSCGSTVKSRNEAQKEFEAKLASLNSFLNGEPDTSLRIIGTISFFEKVTGIMSESDGSDIGKFNPTKQDYLNWQQWYEVNKTKIYLDSDTGKIAVKQ
ncbi:hypothetical protein Q763_07575 [Flavobacterium beibuense F44-8]|uniref:Lipoprotein n=1 Tax=Flavobacterium beibuense F44-8 TaxID=1406840 RepID=A0A0A2LQI7_9FLAO|nr:hypothetical protein Q763_07575 [Flavobacterium beibuense F44-8]